MTASTQAAGRSIICIGQRGPDPSAVHFAETVTRALGMKLILLHVQGKQSAGEDLIAATRKYLDHEPDQVIRAQGNFEQIIKQELDPEEHELVVLGTSHGLANRVATRLSQRLAERIADSVLLIRNPPTELRNILICTGGHSASNIVIDRGLALAAATGARVSILHVASSSPSMYTGLQALDETLQDVLERDTPLSKHLRLAAERAEKAGIEAKLELRHGVVAEEILRAEEIGHYDLIVIGAPEPKHLFNRLALGSVGPQLFSSATSSILVARTDPAA
jgi:nucleotide-binding universal stress UspA family protein